MTTLIAAADGSALGNPGPAGWAWYIDADRWHAGGWPHGTNNQGELMAVIDLFEATAASGAELTVLCDSQYVINAVTTWMPAWKRRGWRKADGRAVLNRELLERLDAALADRRYSFRWVKGHDGHPLNEAADKRARAVATAFQTGSAIPSGPGFEPDSAVAAPSDGTPDQEGSDQETLLRLEHRLFDADLRASEAQLDALLHPAFEEIGPTGRRWNRAEAIAALSASPASGGRIEHLTVSFVAADVALTRYHTTDARGGAQRSSLWLRTDGRWQLRQHQATPSSRPDASAPC